MTRHLIHSLHKEHFLLEGALREEVRRPGPDSSIVRAIKRRKLQVKDRLQMLEMVPLRGSVGAGVGPMTPRPSKTARSPFPSFSGGRFGPKSNAAPANAHGTPPGGDQR